MSMLPEGTTGPLLLEPVDNFFGIRVIGDQQFIARTREALVLLSGLKEFAIIKKPVISLIRKAERSGMRADALISTFDVGPATVESSPVWYASAIAHDGYHSFLFHEEKKRRAGRPPNRDAWTGVEAEKRCLAFQLKVLEQLTDDETLLSYVKENMTNPKYHEISGDKRDW